MLKNRSLTIHPSKHVSRLPCQRSRQADNGTLYPIFTASCRIILQSQSPQNGIILALILKYLHNTHTIYIIIESSLNIRITEHEHIPLYGFISDCILVSQLYNNDNYMDGLYGWKWKI